MSKRLTTEEFQDKLNQLHNGEFKLIGEYVRNSDKVYLLHKKCGNIIYKRASKMIMTNPEYCYICTGKNKWKTPQSFREEIRNKYGNKYTIIEDYINAKTPILIKNNECGHEYKISPDNLLRGRGCPLHGMKQSSYMSLVEDYLTNKNILYIKEKVFEECKYQRHLPFDYYLPELNICIEVDGELHYKQGFKNGEEGLKKIRDRDSIKTQYCEKNKIKLIRLPYYEKDNFKKILDKEIIC